MYFAQPSFCIFEWCDIIKLIAFNWRIMLIFLTSAFIYQFLIFDLPDIEIIFSDQPQTKKDPHPTHFCKYQSFASPKWTREKKVSKFQVIQASSSPVIFHEQSDNVFLCSIKLKNFPFVIFPRSFLSNTKEHKPDSCRNSLKSPYSEKQEAIRIMFGLLRPEAISSSNLSFSSSLQLSFTPLPATSNDIWLMSHCHHWDCIPIFLDIFIFFLHFFQRLLVKSGNGPPILLELLSLFKFEWNPQNTVNFVFLGKLFFHLFFKIILNICCCDSHGCCNPYWSSKDEFMNPISWFFWIVIRTNISNW